MNRLEPRIRCVPLRALLSVALAAIALAVPATAAAHVEIVAKSPAHKAKTSIKRVSITLSGPIRGGSLKVFGPDGEKASRGRGGRDPHNFSRLRTRLVPRLAPGRYTARATWVSVDGHGHRATFRFRLVR